MPNFAVIQLQELASNGNTDIGDLLRRTLMIATKLGLNDFRQWALSEINGYKGKNRQDLPPYRVIRGEIKVHNPYRGLIPFQVPHQLSETIAVIEVTESSTSISQLLNNEGSGYIVYNFPPEFEEQLMAMQDGPIKLRPTRTVGENQLTAILGSVRATILEWSLELEADGIMGENLLFSEREKQAAMHNINIQNFQGVLGDVAGGSTINQTNSQQITTSDFSTLARHLIQNGVSQADVEKLQTAVQEDPKPSSIKGFGPKVSAWLGDMIGKAANGGWQVSIAAASGLLASALGRFYGISDN